MNYITPNKKERGFLEFGSNQRYIPFGCNYFDPQTGWAPQLWQQFDEEKTKRHFDTMAHLGVNTVRVFLTIASFMTESGLLSESGIKKADRMLAIARNKGIRIEFAGPDLWEGIPEWASGYFVGEDNAYFLHDEWVDRLQRFWLQFAKYYSEEKAIFSYDLLNEPWLKWDSPLIRKSWGEDLPSPDLCPMDGSGDPSFLQFREQLTEGWISKMVNAIRSSDANHMVTTGFHQLSMPHDSKDRYTLPGFNGKRLTKFLDYAAMHWYPYSAHEHVRPHLHDDPVRKNIHLIRSSLRNGYAGKPMVIEEFGWYGGGEVVSWNEALPYVEEEVQTKYLQMVVEGTRDLADGWMSWAYADTPSSLDVTKKSGLVNEEGEIKVWGQAFKELSMKIVPNKLNLEVRACTSE